MTLVFVNYRTGDGEATATLIERELSHRFGSEKIFRASKSIRPAEEFGRALLRAVWRSTVMVAVIGPDWLTAPDDRGGRALDDPADWTRREIVEALNHDVAVLPVLVGKAPRLVRDTLPEDLRPLADRQYVRLDHRAVEADLTRLADEVAALAPGLAPTPPPPPAGTATTTVDSLKARGITGVGTGSQTAWQITNHRH